MTRGSRPASGRAWPGAALAVPGAAWYLVFFVVPLAIILVYSLGYKPPVMTARSSIGLDRPSLDNYRALASPLVVDLFVMTLRTAALGTLLCLLLALPVAYVLATRVPRRWRALALGLVIVPFWTSFLLRTFAWRILLAGNGPVSTLLQEWGLLSDPLNVLGTTAAVQLGVVYNYLPLMIFPVFVAFDRLDPALREASQDLGANRLSTFLQVTLPLACPGMTAGALLVFIPLAGEYVTPSILGGVRGAMAGNLIASQFLEAQHWALGSAQAVALSLAILLVVAMSAALVGAARRVLGAAR